MSIFTVLDYPSSGRVASYGQKNDNNTQVISLSWRVNLHERPQEFVDRSNTKQKE